MTIILGTQNKVLAQTVIKNDSIKPYIHFLENNSFLSAKEYILSKFDAYDIVVLSERLHPDITQYDLILDVIRDEKFKGCIYTEVGVSNMAQKINAFLLNDTFTAEEKEKELLDIYRDIDYWVAWENYNYYQLLSEIYEINKNRKKEDKILIFPTDIAFDWNDYTTSEAYALFINLIDDNCRNCIDRNDVMGRNFVDFYETIKHQNPNKRKALVIQNTYHAYIRIPTCLPYPTKPDIYSAGEYIYKTYPDKTFGIYINGMKNWPLGHLSNGGVIDAAFEYTEKDDIGFDLKGTPIGIAKFDLYNFGGSDFADVNFEYIFDGMVFYKPINGLVLKQGIPNFYPKEHENKFFSRIAIANNQKLKDARKDKENIDYLKQINTPTEKMLDEEVIEIISKQIKKWIE